ncbi:hypothetical protein FACS189472_09570 [Alphaproteobacteria bacterium]|nr:hypothetical protein FACS189472_09570 [Alphaproteobacteria bacterium]
MLELSQLLLGVELDEPLLLELDELPPLLELGELLLLELAKRLSEFDDDLLLINGAFFKVKRRLLFSELSDFSPSFKVPVDG